MIRRATYRRWDREQKLGPPPWPPHDPKVKAWEAAHGHDVRLKCYPEFGCALYEVEHDRYGEALELIRDNSLTPGAAAKVARAALAGEDF